MYETLLMIHWREWKRAMPETPSGTERMSRATQPDVKAAEGGKAVIYYADNNIWACSWIFSVWLVELFWSRTDQTQIRAGNLPLSMGTAMFSLVFIIQHTPCPTASIVPSMLTALGEVLATWGPPIPALKAFLERQLDCLDAQQNCLLCMWEAESLVRQGGSHSKSSFPTFSPFLPVMHLKCNHHICSALLQWVIIWQLLFWALVQPRVDRGGNKSFAYRANILSSPAVHPNEILPDSLEWFHAS